MAVSICFLVFSFNFILLWFGCFFFVLNCACTETNMQIHGEKKKRKDEQLPKFFKSTFWILHTSFKLENVSLVYSVYIDISCWVTGNTTFLLPVMVKINVPMPSTEGYTGSPYKLAYQLRSSGNEFSKEGVGVWMGLGKNWGSI